MAYRARFTVNIDWVGPGMGPMSGLTESSPSGGASSYTLQINNSDGGSVVEGTGTAHPAGHELAAADLAGLLNPLGTDILTQVTAALPRLATWPQGGSAAG